jgi:PAS domain S-box-containing protein
MLDVPIRVAGHMAGVICHEHTGPAREWALDEQNFAASMADLVALVMETHERKQAETALRESEERLQAILDNSTAVIYLKDTEGRYILINRRYETLFHVTRAQIVGLTDYDLFPPEAADAFRANDRRVLETGGALELEEVAPQEDGLHTYISIKFPLRDSAGAPYAVCGISTDITERKRAENELRESEEKFRAVTQSANDAIISANSDGLIISWNKGAQAIFGYPEAEVLGHPVASLMPERYRAAHRHGMGRLKDGGEPHVIGRTVELHGLRKDGSEFPLELSLATWRTGERAYYSGIIRDITERKRIEEERQRARDAALELARVKSEFLANMSHEIRTPMNAIIGMSELLTDTELTPEQRDLAETVQASAEALLRIINDILDFSKLEAGKLRFETVDFDLCAVVEGASELLAKQAQAKGIELAEYVERDVPRLLRGDPGRLRQVLTNLLSNAVKFTEQGEVVLRVAKEEETDQEAVVRFTVSDTGVGIAEEAQSRLFQAFSQADGSTTRKYGGTGLGLAISKQLVEVMGGEIGVESQEGCGSTFFFTARFEKQPAVLAAAQAKAELAGVRVLVVDDNATNRKLVYLQITSWGMRNGGAGAGAEALGILRREAAAGDPYQLAILDLQMPEMDGLMLARAIKADPEIASTRLVLMTSLGHRIEAEQLQASGIAAYLTKPVKQSQLYDCLAMVMAGTAAPRPISRSGRLLRPRPPESPPAPAPLPEGARRPARILVAEDNALNQEVALRQLRRLGYAAEAVANGREVLGALAYSHYDLVLMDCQMPELDGYAATAEIRRREGASRHTPIIAMTANALEGDREQCLKAGMDDYLSKPVKQGDLAVILARWLPAPSLAAEAACQEEAATERGEPLDTSVLESLRALQAEGESDLLLRLIDLFFHHAPLRLKALGEALAQGNAQALVQAAHSLKGICGNLGAREMAALCDELEKQGRAGALSRAEALLAQLGEEYARVCRALEAKKGTAA